MRKAERSTGGLVQTITALKPGRKVVSSGFGGLRDIVTSNLGKSDESQSKPGTEKVYPNPCKKIKRRLQLFLAGTAHD